MSEENVEVVRRANAALNRGDIEGLLSEFTVDAQLRDLRSAPDQPLEVTGKEAMQAVLGEWIAAFDGLRADVHEWIDAGDAVIAHAHWWGRGRESGLAIDSVQYDRFELRDGRIVGAVLGFDARTDALEAARPD